MSDLAAGLGLTTRSVSTLVGDSDGDPVRRVVLARTFPTDQDDLWDAVTSPERLPRWFLPVSGDLREGGTYQFEGNAGGTVEVCEPPRRVRVTWGMGDGEPVRVTLTLTPDGAGTRLELEQVGPVAAQFWDAYGPAATGLGWDLGFVGLEGHVGPGDPAVTPEQAAAWMGSPEGLAVMRASADAWAAADVADGTADDVATARAALTVAVFTGEAPPPDLG